MIILYFKLNFVRTVGEGGRGILVLERTGTFSIVSFSVSVWSLDAVSSFLTVDSCSCRPLCSWEASLSLWARADSYRTQESKYNTERVRGQLQSSTLVCNSAVRSSILPSAAVRATSFFCSCDSNWWHCSLTPSIWSNNYIGNYKIILKHSPH